MAQVNPIPEGARTLTPYLVVRDCAGAISFYERALGARETSRVSSPDGKSIWHVELLVGDSAFFLCDELPRGPRAPSPAAPVPVTMWLYVNDCDASFRRAVDAGARGTMNPADMFWGDRMATVADPYGYTWAFATRQRVVTDDELRRSAEEFAREMQVQHPE